MGGQKGGMTNEQGDFPAVCNKSVQAQSTDAQRPIPLEIFEHSLAEISELSAHQLEHMGRLNIPLFKYGTAKLGLISIAFCKSYKTPSKSLISILARAGFSYELSK